MTSKQMKHSPVKSMPASLNNPTDLSPAAVAAILKPCDNCLRMSSHFT